MTPLAKIALWLLRFVQTPLGRIVTTGALVLLVGLFYGNVRYAEGVRHQKAEYAKALEKGRAKVARVEAKSAVISADVAEKNDRRQVEIQTVTKTLIKEVPYAVLQDPARLNVSSGFVWLHDSAATGVPIFPDPAGRPDAAPSAVTDAQLAETLIGNYGTCLAISQTLIALQDWTSRQAANTNAAIKATP